MRAADHSKGFSQDNVWLQPPFEALQQRISFGDQWPYPPIQPGKIPNLKAFPLRFLPPSSIHGQAMGSSATPSVNPIAAELEAARPQRTRNDLMRRVRQRRQIQFMIAASYMVDGLVLL